MVLTLKQFEEFIPTKKTFAVMGFPVSHSLSPALHGEFSKETGVDFDYIAIEVAPDDFPKALEIAREKLSGFNLTMPLKQIVIPYLDELDAEVKITGSANTVMVKDGKLHGHTTDGVGLADALLLNFKSLNNKNILLLGAGGAARSVASALIQCNAKVTVAVRSQEKGKKFSADFSCNYVLFDEIQDDFDILINATPVGMKADDPSPIDISKLKKLEFVYDCIYNPPLTGLLKDAKAMGLPCDNGLSMLVLQGAYSEKHWFSADIPMDTSKKIIKILRSRQALTRLKELYGKQNIVLTGFMGSGKTTVGKWLADALNLHFIDLDAKIEAEQKMKISEIFDKFGEEYFRSLETNACKDCLNLSNMVIATGGGTVINRDNDKILKENSLVIFLNRTLDEIYKNLEGSTNRPLLKVDNVNEHIRSLYELRQPKYSEHADISISFPDNSDPVNEILLSI